MVLCDAGEATGKGSATPPRISDRAHVQPEVVYIPSQSGAVAPSDAGRETPGERATSQLTLGLAQQLQQGTAIRLRFRPTGPFDAGDWE